MNWLRWSLRHLDHMPPRPNEWSWRGWAGFACSCAVAFMAMMTWAGLADGTALTLKPREDAHILLDRHGQVLSEAASAWNIQNQVPLYRVPDRMQAAMLTAEDRRFHDHRGVDWLARLHALWQGLRSGRNVRGASTITEQVVRMLVPRPRTLWSKWLEGFDAHRLEMRYSKADILEFYLNQVPYAANRRGIANAAAYYFDRDLDTLDTREMIALAILPRAPSGLDPYRGGARILDRRSIRLANAMRHEGILPGDEWERAVETPLSLRHPPRASAIGHFRNYVEAQLAADPWRAKGTTRIETTLDGGLVSFAQDLLDERLKALKPRGVRNGAVLIADHRTGEILAWAVAGADAGSDTPGRFLDAVLIPRQPGSTLKPFLYAAAFDEGWSPASRIEDAPYAEAIGSGLHQFNNYSHQFYGDVSVRQALGNSLNIPAVHAVNFVGPDRYLDLLHRFGFSSLKKSAGFYGDGLALGNGEVSLLELVRGYAALANGGVVIPLKAVADDRPAPLGARIVSRDAATMIGNVLSDPWARVMEFGRYSTLNLPIQTAVKTGTSTDYRDAWAVGFDSRYVVGIWMGNLDQTPMDGITGSTGPGLVLRGLFSYLNRDRNSARLPLAGDLQLSNSCAFGESGCEQIYDLQAKIGMRPAAEPSEDASDPAMLSPTPGLRLAYDPRLPADRQVYRFLLGGVGEDEGVTWVVNGEVVGRRHGPAFPWLVRRGSYVVEAMIDGADGARQVGPVAFSVR